MNIHFKLLSEFNVHWKDKYGTHELILCQDTFEFVVHVNCRNVSPDGTQTDSEYNLTLEEERSTNPIVMAPGFYESWHYLNEHGDRFKALWEAKRDWLEIFNL